jgi:hypothetical protein
MHYGVGVVPAPPYKSRRRKYKQITGLVSLGVSRTQIKIQANRLISLIPRPRRRRSRTRRIEPSVYPTRSAISSTLALLVFRRCTARSTRKLWK